MDLIKNRPDDLFELDWRLLSLEFPLYQEPWQTSTHWTNRFLHVPIPSLALDLEHAHDALCSAICTPFRRPSDPLHPIWRFPESPAQNPDERIERFSTSTIKALRDACPFPELIQFSRTQTPRREELIDQLPFLVEALCLDLACPPPEDASESKRKRL